jgi:NADPH:quinone reductase-like Zn-dependent oxidoreductase
VVTAIGDGAEGPAGPVSVGDEVVAYPVTGAFADAVTLPASAVVPKPPEVPWAEASGTLLVGATAVHALTVLDVARGETVLIHGGSGSVGRIAAQLAVETGATVIATASERQHDVLRGYGAIPVAYGPGLADRLRAVAPEGLDAAFDTVGTDEAVDVSLELVEDRQRIVSIAAFGRADTGIRLLGGGPGADPGTEIRRDAWRRLLPAAASGNLTIVVSAAFPLAEAADAVRLVQGGHPGGKVVLLP